MNENGTDLEQGLNRILSDPAALASIMNIVSGLSKNTGNTQTNHSGNAGSETEVTPDALQASTRTPADAPVNVPAPQTVKNDRFNNSLGLLCAIKPFLDTERAQKLDKITQILKVVSITDLLK